MFDISGNILFNLSALVVTTTKRSRLVSDRDAFPSGFQLVELYKPEAYSSASGLSQRGVGPYGPEA
jgi:hypothetical protein